MPVGGGETNHVYEVTYTPPTCETVNIGDRIRLYVVDPPPKTIVLNYGHGCDGVVATLVS